MDLLVVKARGILHVCVQVLLASKLRDLREIRRVVRTLAKERVTVDAIILVPDILAGDDGRRNVLCIRELAELAVAFDRHPEKHEGRDCGTRNGEDSGLSLIHRSAPTSRRRSPPSALP